jgi:outer membrane receptor protein involved in Fe transport
MVTLGVEGHFHDDWSWGVSYDHANAADDVNQRDLLDNQRFFAALDAVTNPATGQTVCNVTLNPNPAISGAYAGCQPLNILNPAATPAGLAYSEGTSTYRAVNTQDHVDASIQGNVWHVPAGQISLALGAEFRRATLDLTSNSNPALLETPAEQNAYFAGLRGVPPGTLAYYLTDTGIAHAAESVKEAFGEVNIPIFKDAPFAQSFDLNGAGRVTDYSTSGTVETWKGGFTWRPIEDVLLRGTDSRDIRAPTLYEFYSGANSGTGQLYDPVTNTTQNVSTITSGNPNLKPEIGSTYTFGLVFSPHAVENFSVAVDYYHINVTGSITTLSTEQIVTNCATTGADCQLVTRPTPTSFPTLITVAPTNSSFLKTSGIDFDASYRTGLAGGELGVRLYANYLQHFVTQESVTEPAYDNAGYATVGNQPTALPHRRATLNIDYRMAAFNFFVSEQYIGGLSLDSPQPDNVYVNPDVPTVYYTNAMVSYRMPMDKGNVETYLNVGNLFDKQPPLEPGSIPGLNLPTIISLYDTVGRTFTLGARCKF